MQTLTEEILEHKLDTPCLKRQTHMHCMSCDEVAELYNQKECHRCKSMFKWSIPWKNCSKTDTL